MNRRGENHVGAWWVKSPSFTRTTKKLTNNIGEQIRVIIFEKAIEKVTYNGKSSFLDCEPSTMIHADSVSFLTFYFTSND